MRFLPDGNHICVTDAGAPFVRIYARPPQGWDGVQDPLFSVRVLDEATYRRGHYNPAEGGPKGIDLDAKGEIMAVTCEEQALAFFRLPSVFDAARR